MTKFRSTVGLIVAIAFLGAGVYGIVSLNYFGKMAQVFLGSRINASQNPHLSAAAANGNAPQGEQPYWEGQDSVHEEGAAQGERTSVPRPVLSLGTVGRYSLAFAFFVSATMLIVRIVDAARKRKHA